MGTGVSRIEQEFVLSTVHDKTMPVKVHANRQESEGRIVSLSDSEMVIELAAPLKLLHDERLRVFFSYFGHVMTFTTRARNVEDRQVTVAYPKGLYKNLQRKYERVLPPVGTKAYFTLSSTKVELNFPKSEEYDPVDKPQFSDKFRPESIAELVRSFRESVSARCTENSVMMFRDRQPSGYEEEIIAKTAKMLLITGAEGGLPLGDSERGERFITREMIAKAGSEIGAPQIFRENFAALLQRKRKQGVVSELYCPILFHEYVIGYVYLLSKTKDFDQDLVDHVLQFSQVLAYSLKINNYFKGADVDSERYETQILNLSASGMLFAHNSAKLKDGLMIYTDVPVVLVVKERKMVIGSRIMRKYEDALTCYFGVQFLEIQPEDFRYLFELVYGRPFTKEDGELWEGGTAPPPLEL